MKRSNVALALVFAGALLGCGDGGATGNASAEPGKSGAASAQAKGSSAPATSGTAVAGKAEKAEPAAAGGGAEVLKHMPKDCDEGRVYANVGKLLGGGSAGALETLMAKNMGGSKDAKKSEEVIKVLKDGGIDPVNSLKELAVCSNKDKKKTVVAASVDFSKAEKPGDVIAKAIETGSGKAPKKEEAGDVTWLTTADNSVIGVSKTKLLAGDDKAALEAAWKGGDGASAFGDAGSHTVWADMGDTKVNMKEAGDDYDLKVVTKVGPNAPKMKEQFEKTLPEIDKLTADPKMAFVKPLLPAVKNAKLDVAGEILNVVTKFPKAAINEFLTGLKDVKPEDLMKGMRF
jgi:hypothetical protein